MKFYCVVRSLEDKRFPNRCVGYLKDACKKWGIEFILIESHKVDFTNLPVLKKGDMLYRVTTDLKSSNVFAHLLTPGVITFYKDIDSGSISYTSNGWSNTIAHRLKDLPIIPSIIDLPASRELLDKYVDHLGGYPLIIKAQGGSHGVGVMRVDSPESLYSISDYLRSLQKDSYALRKYIDFKAQARLIVVGDKVVASLDYTPPAGDFRSNIGSQPIAKAVKFSPEIEAAAVAATHVSGYEFGGVDILVDRNGKEFYIAEVNNPCNFARAQSIAGVDVADAMLEHLISKSEASK